MRLVALAAGCLALHATAMVLDEPSRASLVGCWRLAPGRFAIVDKLPADSGQTDLPAIIRMDLMPGTTWSGARAGHRVRTVVSSGRSSLEVGYYQFQAPDRVTINWSAAGTTGMTLDVRFDRSTLRGSATAWTDYGGAEVASIALHRVRCPTA